MKPRPVPTSPKSTPVADPTELLRPSATIVPPVVRSRWGSLMAMIVVSAIVGVIVSVAVLRAVTLNQSRSFIRRWLPLPNTNGTERVTIRTVDEKASKQFRDALTSVTPSLGALYRNAGQSITASNQFVAPVIFLTSDGVGVALQLPLKNMVSPAVALSNGEVIADPRHIDDPASPLSLIRINGRTASLEYADETALQIGAPVMIVTYDLLRGGITAAPASIASVNDVEPSSSDLLMSSDRANQRYRVDIPFAETWNGAAVTDERGRLVGILETFPDREALIVPIHFIRDAAARAKTIETLDRPVFGVMYYDLAHASWPMTHRTKGALLASSVSTKQVAVQPKSPAAKSGFRLDDIIISVDDEPLTDVRSLSDAILAHRPGDPISVTYLRGTKEARTTVTLSSTNQQP